MISVDVHCAFDEMEVDSSEIEVLVREVCRRHGMAQVTVSIAVVGSAEISEIHRQFLGGDDATDCLSFDLSDEAGKIQLEIVVNGERAVHEAETRGHTPAAELALYVTHGLLHYLGFDDATSAQAKMMHAEEDAILRDLGYGNVFHHEVNG